MRSAPAAQPFRLAHGGFPGVVAGTEGAAVAALERLRAAATGASSHPADGRPLGAGEAALRPTAATIAASGALGLRVRDLPVTRDRIRAAMEGDPDA